MRKHIKQNDTMAKNNMCKFVTGCVCVCVCVRDISIWPHPPLTHTHSFLLSIQFVTLTSGLVLIPSIQVMTLLLATQVTYTHTLTHISPFVQSLTLTSGSVLISSIEIMTPMRHFGQNFRSTSTLKDKTTHWARLSALTHSAECDGKLQMRCDKIGLDWTSLNGAVSSRISVPELNCTEWIFHSTTKRFLYLEIPLTSRHFFYTTVQLNSHVWLVRKCVLLVYLEYFYVIR